MDAQTIPTSAMAGHLATGEAEALLPVGVPGPVRLTGQWWAVPTGHADYRPVNDPTAVRTFEQGLARLATHRAHRAQTGTRTGPRQP